MRIVFLLAFFLFMGTKLVAQIKNEKEYTKTFVASSIPADLKKEGLVLIVMSPYKKKQTKENDALKALFDSKYKGTFIIIPDGEKLKPEYVANPAQYKYWLMAISKTERAVHEYQSIIFFDRSKFNIEKPDAAGMMDTGLYDHHSRYDDMITFILGKIPG